MDVRAQTKFIDGIFHILQDLRLLSQLLGPIWVEIEAERVEVGVHVTAAAIMSVVRSMISFWIPFPGRKTVY